MAIIRVGFLLNIILHLLCPSALGMVAFGIASDSSCHGSLVLGYEDDQFNLNFLRLDGSRDTYRNIKRGFPHIKGHTISTIEVHGNCCWELYPRRGFQGEYQVAYPEEGVIYIDFQPGSIRKKECPY